MTQMRQEKIIGVVAQKMSQMKIPQDDIHTIGTVARILRVLPDGNTTVMQGKNVLKDRLLLKIRI
jgi:ATP-dependent Lon protease